MKKLPLLSLIGVALVVLSFIALKSNPAVEVTLYGDTLAVVEETADTADTSNLDTEESSSEDGKIDIEQDIDETATTPESQFPSLTEGEDSTEQQGEDAVEAEEGLPIPDESDEEDLPSSG
ncbi:MAG: hypothetical protein LBO09_02795 [Candidatus Peribacteria bacterium]|jgi:hypothetical protein|nr:hypothetical protein [Candidatus Peribacteria bacterium]